jgi:hypothetical protein
MIIHACKPLALIALLARQGCAVSTERRLERAEAILEQRADADSLATAGLCRDSSSRRFRQPLATAF